MNTPLIIRTCCLVIASFTIIFVSSSSASAQSAKFRLASAALHQHYLQSGHSYHKPSIEVLYRTISRVLNSRTEWVKVTDSSGTYLLVVSDYKKKKKKRQPEVFGGLRYFILTSQQCLALKNQLSTVDRTITRSENIKGRLNDQQVFKIAKGVSLMINASCYVVPSIGQKNFLLLNMQLWVGNRAHYIGIDGLLKILTAVASSNK